MKQAGKTTRRGFLQYSSQTLLAASLAPMIVPSSVLGNEVRPSPSNRITVGCIGVGPRGATVMRQFLKNKHAQVVAVCDVKSNVLADNLNKVNQYYDGKGCKAYQDFRDLVASDGIDAVLIGTPDHWHVLPSLAAVRSGKDVYMEKPMGLSLAEDQAMRLAVEDHSRIFQFGTQQRSSSHFRQACNLVRTGRIGQLKHINVWAPGSVAGGPNEPAPIPAWLDYDFWLGPAAFKPYTQNRCSNQYWWFHSDYALGFIAGWGIHPLDIGLWGASDQMTGPWKIHGKAEIPTKGICDTAVTWDVHFEFGSGLTMNYRGLSISENTGTELKKTRAFANRYGSTLSHGTAFEGTEGWVHVDRKGVRTYPENLANTSFKPEEPILYQSENHVGNFLDCVRSRQSTICPVEEAVQADILCHVSDIAARSQQPLIWDPIQELFIGDDQANHRLNRSMRNPWNLQTIS